MSKIKGFFVGSEVRGSAPKKTLPQCGACGLHKKCNSPKMAVAGDGKWRVLFVGSMPGDVEDKRGEHMCGNPGKYMRRVLRDLGFEFFEDGWKTNAIICNYPKPKKMSTVVGYCRPNVLKTIRELSPDVIVLMGRHAVHSVIGAVWKEDTGSIDKWTGWQIPSHEYNAWLCPIQHPSFVLYSGDMVIERQFKSQLQAAIDIKGKPWDIVPDLARDVKLVMDAKRAAKWLRKAARQKTGAVAFDYETNMLKPEGGDARIVSCSVAWGREKPERCIAYPWYGEAVKATRELLESGVPKIGANMKFEERWTHRILGCRVNNWVWDSVLAAHVLDNRPGVTSVKFQGFVRHGIPIWNERIDPFLKSKGDSKVNQIIQNVAVKDLLLYNGLDSLIEFMISVDQIREMGRAIPWETGSNG